MKSPLISLPFIAVLSSGAVLLALAWMGVSAAFFDPIRQTGDRVAALNQELSQLSLRDAALAAQLGAAPATSDAAPTGLVSIAPSAAASSEAFQEAIRNDVAAVHGVSISSQASAQGLPGGTAKIRILLRARFDELGLMKFTRAVESSTPSMIFESFEVHPVSAGQGHGLLEFTGMLAGFHADAR